MSSEQYLVTLAMEHLQAGVIENNDWADDALEMALANALLQRTLPSKRHSILAQI